MYVRSPLLHIYCAENGLLCENAEKHVVQMLCVRGGCVVSVWVWVSVWVYGIQPLMTCDCLHRRLNAHATNRADCSSAQAEI